MLADTPSESGDLLPGARRPPRGLSDARQILDPIGRAAPHVAEVAADALQQLGRPIERATSLLNGSPAVPGLTPTLLGELVHFVRDHRESASVNAGAGCFDRGVEREQVRLVRDESDGLREFLDLLRDVAQARYFARAFFGGRAQVRKAADRVLGGEADLLGSAGHLGAGVARRLAGGGDLPRVLRELCRVARECGPEARPLGGALARAPGRSV